MNKKSLDTLWDQTRLKYGIYLRLLEAIPDAKYQSRVIPGMRTPAELVAHVSGGIVRGIAQGVAKGEVKSSDAAEATTAQGLNTKADAAAYARRCWKEASNAVEGLSDAQLGANMKALGMALPGAALIHILHDELLHHRGQLYAYVRAVGGEPPFIASFADNAPEFAPKT